MWRECLALKPKIAGPLGYLKRNLHIADKWTIINSIWLYYTLEYFEQFYNKLASIFENYWEPNILWFPFRIPIIFLFLLSATVLEYTRTCIRYFASSSVWWRHQQTSLSTSLFSFTYKVAYGICNCLCTSLKCKEVQYWYLFESLMLILE
jgi:hypothetical protein